MNRIARRAALLIVTPVLALGLTAGPASAGWMWNSVTPAAADAARGETTPVAADHTVALGHHTRAQRPGEGIAHYLCKLPIVRNAAGCKARH